MGRCRTETGEWRYKQASGTKGENQAIFTFSYFPCTSLPARCTRVRANCLLRLARLAMSTRVRLRLGGGRKRVQCQPRLSSTPAVTRRPGQPASQSDNNIDQPTNRQTFLSRVRVGCLVRTYDVCNSRAHRQPAGLVSHNDQVYWGRASLVQQAVQHALRPDPLPYQNASHFHPAPAQSSDFLTRCDLGSPYPKETGINADKRPATNDVRPTLQWCPPTGAAGRPPSPRRAWSPVLR